MLNPKLVVVALLGASSLAPLAAAAVATCSGHGVQVQVLGSGGPELEDKRAASSYLVWQDARPRILVDSGSEVMSDLKNMLIFATFRPATTFGRPTAGRAILSFSKIQVKG